jgi:hypothetical protein
MWVVKHDVVVELPDHLPVPDGSEQVEVPEDFFEQPETYEIADRRLRRRTDVEPRPAVPKLTPEEIERLKRALEEGRI